MPRVLVWDESSCDVFWRPDSTITGAMVDNTEVAFGCSNNAGITSSEAFKFSSTQSSTWISDNSTIIGGTINRVTMISNTQSDIRSSCHSILGASRGSTISEAAFAVVLSSRCSIIDSSVFSSALISSVDSCICKSVQYSSIINSRMSLIYGGNNSTIISSCGSKICGSNYSIILNKGNNICNSCNSIILGSNGSLICSATNSAIIGGKGLTLSNVNNQVITPSLCVSGSLALEVITASSNITLATSNFTLLAYAPSNLAGMTVSLPAASLARHRLYVIKKMDASTQSFIFIKPNTGDNIEGITTYITLENPYDYNMLQSDGVSTWIKLGGAVGINLW